MKNLLIIILLIPYLNFAQESEYAFSYDNFEEEIMSFTPTQHPDVTDKVFSKGKFYLEQTKAAVRGDNGKFTCADYWNLTVAFDVLKEPKEHIEIAFKKAIKDSPTSICSYIESSSADFSDVIPEIFNPFMAKCNEIQATNPKEELNVEEYIQKNNYEAQLVKTIHLINKDDQKHRGIDELDKQKPYDIKNQQIIDSLFAIHKQYIGNSLVGEKLELAMFMVIQHSYLEYMEKYLPVIQKAVANGELKQSLPLKMLLDRIYFIKEGKQIFGSQGGVPIAEESVRKEVIAKYNLE